MPVPKTEPVVDTSAEVEDLTDAQLAAQDAPTDNTPKQPVPAADLEAQALSAFTAGVKKASGEAADTVDGAAADDTVAGAAGDDTAAGAEVDDEVDEDEEQDEEAAAEEEAAKAAVEKEIKDLGLTNKKSADRFRALNDENRKFRNQHKQMVAYTEQAAAAMHFNELVMKTGAQPNQVGTMLGYLGAVNSNDEAAMKKAHALLGQEYAWLSRRLGIAEVNVDPLMGFDDLRKKVDSGAMDLEDAVETAKLREQAQRTQQATQQATQSQEQRAAAEREALADIAELGETLRAADPAFDTKLAALTPTIARIQANTPPQEWRRRIGEAYRALPAPASAKPAARPVVRVGGQPLRPVGAGGQPMDRKPKDELDAFQMGVQAAKQRGR